MLAETTMSSAHPSPRLDAAGFLEWERRQPVKHEFVAGEVFAMTGATDAHVTVAGNLFALLRAHVRGTPCRVFMADMKLRVETADAFFYPDVFVTCAESDRQLAHYKTEPPLIVEVLSESTAAYDRGRKFACYRQLTSLREYVLIDPEALSVDVFRRGEHRHFVLYPFGPGERIELESISFATPIEALYEDVALDAGD